MNKQKIYFSTTGHTPRITPIMKEIPPKAPTVFYTSKAWNTVWHLVDSVNTEISWFGYVEQLGDDFIVQEIFVPEQEVSGVTTDILPEAEASLLFDLVSRDLCPSKLTLWGHSHVNMGVTPSGTDENEVASRLENSNMVIRAIHNKKRDIKCDIYMPERNVIYENVESRVYVPPLEESIITELNNTIKTKVSLKSYQYNYNAGSNRDFFNKPSQYGKKKTKGSKKEYDLVDDLNIPMGMGEDYHLLYGNSEQKTEKNDIELFDPEDGLALIETADGKFFTMIGTEIPPEKTEEFDLIYMESQFKCGNLYEALDNTLHKTLTEMFEYHAQLAIAGELLINVDVEVPNGPRAQ